MLGDHCIQTWSSSQGAFALSSAEAELYAMVEGATRAKGLLTLAKELGYVNISNGISLGTDSSAAKSFISRRGLGRMKHLQIRDLWLQKEVAEGGIRVFKVPGDENPADLMTKILSAANISRRLNTLNIHAETDALVEEIPRANGEPDPHNDLDGHIDVSYMSAKLAFESRPFLYRARAIWF